jgi:type II secretory ATPase GspE/PulE/Tfp pilus assembly ATPase PilB-like protein
MGTMRILDKSFAVRTLNDIGFSPGNLIRYEKMLKSPFGMILISGPTGSGKTTTLYASINSLDCKELKIITIEDPVEYHFEGINQIQVNPRAGLTFSDGLRAIMRHDPDVALVGEIRDRDTAAVAVQASMTGHLVLASVHANDTVGVLFRLIDLGIEPFLLASALVGVVAQRMVRRVCPHCREESLAPVEHQAAYQEELGEPKEKFFRGKGCQMCADTGYLGRTAVMEILTMSDEMRRLLLAGAGTSQIRAQAIKEGMVSMRHDGMLKVKDGITTPNEVLRNVFSIE